MKHTSVNPQHGWNDLLTNQNRDLTGAVVSRLTAVTEARELSSRNRPFWWNVPLQAACKANNGEVKRKKTPKTPRSYEDIWKLGTGSHDLTVFHFLREVMTYLLVLVSYSCTSTQVYSSVPLVCGPWLTGSNYLRKAKTSASPNSLALWQHNSRRVKTDAS